MGCSAHNYDDEVKWEADEDEALSLSDLPVKFITEENKIQTKNEEDGDEDEDFNFGSLGGSLSTEQEMCVADEVFFQGQILPLRLSVSSDSGLTRCHQDSLYTNRCLTKSESMDHGSLNRFTSVSSKSSSFNSISNASSSYYKSNSKPTKTRNNFNTHPSPRPNIRLSNSRPINVNSRIQRPSKWDLFRLGLVRAPELELQHLKARSNTNRNGNKNSVSRNSSWSSSNSSSSTKNSSTKIVNKSGEVVAKGFLGKRIVSFSGCKCSVNAVETVPLNNTAMEDKNKKLVQELKVKKEKKEKQEGKQALSRNRTFEWLTELGHGSYVDVALKIDS